MSVILGLLAKKAAGAIVNGGRNAIQNARANNAAQAEYAQQMADEKAKKNKTALIIAVAVLLIVIVVVVKSRKK